MKQPKRKWSELSKEELKEIKQLYTEYKSQNDIAKRFNISRSTLGYHINEDGWKVDRELRKAELYSMWTSSKKEKFINMSNDAAKIIQKSLAHLASRSEPPSPREAQQAVAILESLDKITRLDDGKPTEITEEKVMELKDIEAITTLIPFKTKKEEKEVITYVETTPEEEDEDDKKVN